MSTLREWITENKKACQGKRLRLECVSGGLVFLGGYSSFDVSEECNMYGNVEVSSTDISNGTIDIKLLSSPIDPASTKLLFKITKSAEDSETGTISLTYNEAKIINYASDTDNWTNYSGGGYCGSLWVDLETATLPE